MKVASLLFFAGVFASVQAETVNEVLRRSGVVISECKLPKTAALTFDDGPNQYNVDIGTTLRKYGAKGTFFICGNLYHCIYDYADSVRKLFLQGHQIASHSWSHPDLAKLNVSAITAELEKTDQAIQDIIGFRPAYMRPPYGSYNDNVTAVAKARGQDVVIWNFDSQDWNSLTANQSETRYSDFVATKPNTVLALNHETYNTTAHEVLPYAIKLLQKNGYRLVTVAECVGGKPYLPPKPPKPPHLPPPPPHSPPHGHLPRHFLDVRGKTCS